MEESLTLVEQAVKPVTKKKLSRRLLKDMTCGNAEKMLRNEKI